AAAAGSAALDQFTVNLTDRARNGEIDPVLGRDSEIRQVIDILTRRRQNNPILTGEAGVGKTAVVEGFARWLAAGDVPPPLKDVSLRVLDIGLLQAGASMKGEFEERLRAVIEEVQSSPKPIILFIDEAHTLIGAGGAAGTGDAANLLKPALARGTLRTIAATTWAEYKKYFEKDPALTRRFQVVQVAEPDERTATLMMRRMVPVMERHHRVQILDEAVDAAVKLSRRYIPARQLPDKAISLLDTAAARVAISLHAVPAAVDDSRKRIDALETEAEIIGRESVIGIDVEERSEQVAEQLAAERDRLSELEERWTREKDLTGQIVDIQTRLHGSTVDDEGKQPGSTTEPAPVMTERQTDARRGQLDDARADLAAHLGDEPPLICIMVDAQVVGAVVQDWTGIPVGRMVRDEMKTVLDLASSLSKRVIGQDHALEMIAKRIETSRAGLDNPNKPIGVFMLAGPSGVGKTETALALAETLYGGEQNVITINMSEFQEAHSVSTLKGAPPGYVGYGEGGLLTEAVRRRPYSVVLLDEVEKAHPDVHEIFFQIFDKGVMEDGEGRLIDFKNTLILLTSNVGSELIANLCRDPDLTPEPEGLAQMLREPLLKTFPAALLGRLIAIPYFPLSDGMIKAIADLQLSRIRDRINEKHAVPFTYDDDVIDLIARRCTELDSGGRMIDAILTNTILPAISREVLEHSFRGEAIEKVHVEVANGDFRFHF
ncbi:MAG: type VI secretion system ATPase TssH, partial [Geminicoccaceae bacterium]